ncbi:MAG: anti-sigma factor family protein [Gemmatimonadota bacterium]
MSRKRNHPTTERLQALVEETLGRAARAAVRDHVEGCARCHAEVEELRAVFAALEQLPALAPMPGFADRVMSQVRVPEPERARQPVLAGVLAGAGAWLDRVTPSSTRGWATATAVFALPVIGATVLLAWLLAQPGVNAYGLWTLTVAAAGDVSAVAWQWIWTQLSGSAVAVRALQAGEALASVGRAQIGLVAVMFATATAGSLYILYQNLFRTQQQARRMQHGSYVI